jgi:diacylglycerol kinase (ATP)
MSLPASLNNGIILINPYCCQGRGWKRWLQIRDEVHRATGMPMHDIVLEKGIQLEDVLSPALNATAATGIISAGGDGTMHYLVNYLMTGEKISLENIYVGAIGLGSSNDFLKPYGQKIKGLPVRINFQGGHISHDVGMATYSNNVAKDQKKYFIVNASFGVTATANWNFNTPGPMLKFLKKNNTGAAIVYTAISTILGYSNHTCTLSYHNNSLHVPVSNINILKIPFVSGSFFYDQPLTRDDGNLGMNACVRMSRWELLSVLRKLQKGRFPVSHKTITATVKEFHLSSEIPFIFECDGETEKADTISVYILPNALKVLKS